MENKLGWPTLNQRVELLTESGHPTGIHGNLIGYGAVCNGLDQTMSFEPVAMVDVEPESWFHGTYPDLRCSKPVPGTSHITVITIAVSCNQLVAAPAKEA